MCEFCGTSPTLINIAPKRLFFGHPPSASRPPQCQRGLKFLLFLFSYYTSLESRLGSTMAQPLLRLTLPNRFPISGNISHHFILPLPFLYLLRHFSPPFFLVAITPSAPLHVFPNPTRPPYGSNVTPILFSFHPRSFLRFLHACTSSPVAPAVNQTRPVQAQACFFAIVAQSTALKYLRHRLDIAPFPLLVSSQLHIFYCRYPSCRLPAGHLVLAFTSSSQLHDRGAVIQFTRCTDLGCLVKRARPTASISFVQGQSLSASARFVSLLGN